MVTHIRMGNNFSSILIASSVIFVLIFFNSFGILSPVMDSGRLAVMFTLAPLEAGLSSLRALGLTFFSIHDLVQQNEHLAQQVGTLNAELARYERAEEENRILREALGFQAESRYDLVAAEIISFDFLNFGRTAIINRGSRDGLRVGDSAIVMEGVLAGILTEVSDRTSAVELITSSTQSVNARSTSGRATGVVKGDHGLGLLFERVALSEVLEINERVTTSGLGGKFEPNLYIGKVSEIHTKPGDLFQTATIEPAADFRNLQIVFILRER